MHKLSIIVPAYNEAKTIRRVIENILAVEFPIPFEIIVVDDHSADRTRKILELLNKTPQAKEIIVLRNAVNRGKGHSIQRGLEVATGDIGVVQDADFEYDPAEIPKLLAPILNGTAEVVYGSRFLNVKCPQKMAFANYIANRFLTVLTNILFGGNLTDMETCYKLFRRQTVMQLNLKASRFDFEPEITSKFLKQKIRILEIPISYSGRSASEGKKIKARDFFIAVMVLFKNRFMPEQSRVPAASLHKS